MKASEKKKQIVLIVAIIAVIVVGVILLMKTGKEGKKKETSKDLENTTEIAKDIENGELYYKEESRGEEVFEDVNYIKFLKFKDKPVRLSKNSENNKMSLMDMETGDLIYEFPNEEMYKSDGIWIDEEDIFWTIKYYEDLKKVLIKSFDKTGKEVYQAIEPENFEGTLFEDSGLHIENFKCDKKYLYILSYYKDKENKKSYRTLQIYNKDGKLHNTYNNDTVSIYDFDVDGKGSVYIQTERSSHGAPSIKKINMEDGYLGNVMPSEGEFIKYIEEKNQAYILSPTEGVIQEYDINNRKKLGVVFTFGEDSTVLGKSPECTAIDFFVGKNNDFYIAFAPYEEETPYKFFAYREKGKKDNNDRAITLTVTAPYRQDFLAYAIKCYEIKYPEEKIEYNYIYNNREEFLKNNEQYGKQLTMKILSGEIGDVIMTGGSGLIYRDLFKTDAFEDLTPFLEKDQKYKDLNKGVLNGIKINDGIRGLPISFVGYYYQVNEQLAEKLGLNLDYDNLKWSEVLKLTKIIEEKEPDAHLFTRVGEKEDMLITILIANMPDLIDDEKKEANLNQEWFIELIKEFKECIKSPNFEKLVEKLGDDCLQGSLFSYLSNNRGPGSDLYLFEKYNRENISSIIPIFMGEKNSNRVAYTNNMYSINGRSERKEGAWKFLSFLLEENIQAYMWMPGTPINIAGEDKYIKVEEKEMINQNKEISRRFYKERREAYEKIDYLYDMDYFKKDIVDPIMKYLDDEITIEEAIKKAQENVDLRLNE